MKLHILPALIALCSVTLLAGCNKSRQWHVAEGAVWNTTYRIIYNAPEPLDDSIQAVFRDVEMSLSPFNDSSLISLINRGTTDSVDTDLSTVFAISKDVGIRSHGRFDPTVAPLVNLWGFGYDRSRRSEAETDSAGFDVPEHLIAEALKIVGIDQCSIQQGRIIRKNPATTFNFSAVTKGYGCDRIAAMLKRNGSAGHMVEIGGEIAVDGKNRTDGPWIIQIDAPVESAAPVHEELRTVKLEGPAGIATSGNYRNFHRTARFGRFGHTIDPKTGYPVTSDVISATVIAPNAALADAWATACMASTADSAMSIIERQPGVECMLVVTSVADSTRTVRFSSGFPTD